MSIPQTVTAVLALLSALCFGTFRAIGSEVDALGVLREPFFLIPIGWLLPPRRFLRACSPSFTPSEAPGTPPISEV